jgi:hypothetical protein
MTIQGYKRLAVGLGVLAGLLTLLVVLLFVSHFRLVLELAFASDSSDIFAEMRDKALRGDPQEAVGCLEYVVCYYPSGTRLREGSRFDRMVERERACAVREILAYLRARTGLDLGEDPGPWIERFAAK